MDEISNMTAYISTSPYNQAWQCRWVLPWFLFMRNMNKCRPAFGIKGQTSWRISLYLTVSPTGIQTSFISASWLRDSISPSLSVTCLEFSSPLQPGTISGCSHLKAPDAAWVEPPSDMGIYGGLSKGPPQILGRGLWAVCPLWLSLLSPPLSWSIFSRLPGLVGSPRTSLFPEPPFRLSTLGTYFLLNPDSCPGSTVFV